MAGRSRDTYKKRQKEVARAEKAREKAARRMERKLQKRSPEMGVAAGALDENEDNLEEASEQVNSGGELGPSEDPVRRSI